MTKQTVEVLCYDPWEKKFQTKSSHHEVGVRDVLIKTTHSGLCFTDVHAKNRGCGLGHEGVGYVQEVGPAVTNLKSCGHCPTCLSGYRQYCEHALGFAYSDLEQGAFGDYRIIDAEFAYRIPDAITSIDAGPLMCAGASVYEALDAAGTKAGDRVGVVGVGGLGHMAMLFAKAMGCSVTALFASRRPSQQKIKDAFELGADEARCIADRLNELYPTPDSRGEAGEVEEPPREMKINVLLVCSNELPDWFDILPLLDRMARIVLMSIQPKALNIPYMPFILPGHRIISSTEASKRNHIDMLDFAARHKIKPWTETYPMSVQGLSDAMSRLESGQMRYRGVLQW
ncbi:NADP-dependent alcohol dehydrogenase 7 [Sphaceloma murrayae]|uniref:NADP-dependent alcohol dehydrogenase 7 n=1 Tax=Sphaceloma murrayae TaxID=2082308 RepID=A0A2K1QXE4_9PEZI|nr:NADP-dependent alcohol dehydrogenase 7 [Sphaceloma murrayae]